MKTLLSRLLLLVLMIWATAVPTTSSVKAETIPPAPTEARIRFDDAVLTVEVAGDYAYVGLDRALAVLDITYPLQPVTKSVIAGGTITIALSGHYAYTSDNAGFRVIDISNPILPVTMYEKLFPVGIIDLTAYGKNVYVATAFDLYVLDVSKPDNPEIVGRVDQRGMLMALTAAEDVATGRVYVYLVGYGYPPPGIGGRALGGGLRVIDVTDPTDPQEVWPYRNVNPSGMDAEFVDIAVQNGYAYIVGWNNLSIRDISDPGYPRFLTSYFTSDQTVTVAVAGNRAYLSEYVYPDPWRLHTIDISDKTRLRRVSVREMEVYDPAGMAVSKGCLFVAERERGLRILCDASVLPTPPSHVWLPLLATPTG